MGVDKSYGSGYKNSGKSKAVALKPGSQRATAPAVVKARSIVETKRKLARVSKNGFPFAIAGGSAAGVLGSKGFAQAAAKVAGAAQKRFGIQEMKQTMAARKGYTSGDYLNSKITSPKEYANDLKNLTPWAANRAALDLKQTIGPRSAYTALKDEAAKIGRGMSREFARVNNDYAMNRPPPTSAVARAENLRMFAKKDVATALKQEAKKLVKGKNTAK